MPVLLKADELKSLDVAQLIAIRDQQKALLIDIRTPEEWTATGLIPESHPLTFFAADGHYDLDQWLAKMDKLRSTPEQPIILVCRSGNRSGKAGQLLTQTKQMKNVYHLQGGMAHWLSARQPITRNCPNQLACK